MTKVYVEGLRELDAALGELPKSVAKGVLRRIGLKALESVADVMKALAPDDPETSTGDLVSSIGVGTKLSPRQARLNRKGAREAGDKSFVEVYAGAGPAPHAHLMEFGSVNNRPRPFARPAWDQEKDGVLLVIKRDLGTEIDKAAKRAARRAAKARAG